MKRYEIVEHTADVGIRAFGKDLRELFKNAAFGMFNIIADLDGLKPSTTVNISSSAANHEELLVTWLDDLLYNFYTKDIIFTDFDIKELDDKHIKSEIKGRPIGDRKSRLKSEIKAATFHKLRIEKSKDGYEVQIIFDV